MRTRELFLRDRVVVAACVLRFRTCVFLAIRCSALACFVACCNVLLQCVAVCFDALQCIIHSRCLLFVAVRQRRLTGLFCGCRGTFQVSRGAFLRWHPSQRVRVAFLAPIWAGNDL